MVRGMSKGTKLAIIFPRKEILSVMKLVCGSTEAAASILRISELALIHRLKCMNYFDVADNDVEEEDDWIGQIIKNHIVHSGPVIHHEYYDGFKTLKERDLTIGIYILPNGQVA